MACGCTAVVKPASETPLSALAAAALAEEAGIPKGVINIVTTKKGRNGVGDALCYSPKIAAMSFTGSTGVGKMLYKQCAGTVKKLSLELGGNAPFIVFDSADVDLAVAGCMASKFRNSGQTCISTNRVLVQDGIYDRFVNALKEAVETSLVLGNGMEKDVNQGPLVNKSQFDIVTSMVDEAISKGAKLITGGSKHDIGDLFYKPTILTDVNNQMECVNDEIFGPVVAIQRFKSEDEVLTIGNENILKFP